MPVRLLPTRQLFMTGHHLHRSLLTASPFFYFPLLGKNRNFNVDASTGVKTKLLPPSKGYNTQTKMKEAAHLLQEV